MSTLTWLHADAAATQPAASQPALIDASDSAAIAANVDKDAVIDGKIATASWSASGKVMIAKFDGGGQFSAVIFAKNKQKFDDAYAGDVAKALAGAKVRLRGKLQEYKPNDNAKGRPELVLDLPDQITIVEAAPPAASQP